MMTKSPDCPQHGAPDALADRLRERVRRGGPMTFRDWMSAALYDERGGYYRRPDFRRWGRAGDYRTSPGSSPLFAATFARYFARLFEELGRPAPFYLLEAGGGDGRFAAGVLATLRRDAPETFSSTRYVFEEASDDALARAEKLLEPFAGRVAFRRPGRPAPPDAVGVVFSNELLDALPAHRVVCRGGRLLELYVGLGEGGEFAWRELEPSTPRLAGHFESLGVSLAEGQFADLSLEAGEWVARAAREICRGYVVTADYGDEAAALYDAARRPAGSLRAFRGHRFAADVLAHPGAQDLTTTVNWTQARRAGEDAGLGTVLLERQDAFLLRAGLLEQLERETALAASEAETARLRLGAREMILPGGMGESFQVLVQEKRPGPSPPRP